MAAHVHSQRRLKDCPDIVARMAPEYVAALLQDITAHAASWVASGQPTDHIRIENIWLDDQLRPAIVPNDASAEVVKEAPDRERAGLTSSFHVHRVRPLIGGMAALPKQKHLRNRFGRIVRYASALAREALEEAIKGSHLADYALHLQAAGRSENHIWEVVRIIRRVCIECGFALISDLNADILNQYIIRQIEGGKSRRTANAAQKSCKAFVRWLVKSDRLERDPFKLLTPLNEQADPARRERRALTADEANRLIAAAERGGPVQGVTGQERALLYSVALTTGLRRSELASLTRAHLSLDSDPPFILAAAAATKARREDVVPLHPIIAERLKTWLKTQLQMATNTPVFHLKTPTGRLRATSRMMRADCKSANIPYAGEIGCADFHACRATYITNLSRSATTDYGTIVALAQHADARLTSRVYDKVRLEAKASAVNELPVPTAPVRGHAADENSETDGAA